MWAMELSDKQLAARIAKQQPRADRESDQYGQRDRLAVLKWETARRAL
jgi:hypothetical protein